MDKVLVVDDEADILTLLKYNLEQSGYSVQTAADGQTALKLALSGDFDFIILDLMLPGMDGLEVTRRLRIEKMKTPIMILTAKDSETDKIVGLELGADDYVTKPFSPREVIARMKAIKRRTGNRTDKSASTPKAETPIKVGDLEIDTAQMLAKRQNQVLDLTPKEFQLLDFFMQRPNRVLSRDAILNGVWNFDFSAQSRMVDIQISHLRDKIEKDPKHPELIKTVRGFGYKLEAHHE